MTNEERIERLRRDGWHLATHSTILDRRHCQHRVEGKLRFQRTPKAQRRYYES